MSDAVKNLLNFFVENLGKSVSESEISQKLHATPAAVLKNIMNLRKLGYDIETQSHSPAEPSSYVFRHSSDHLKPQEIQNYLKTSFIGRDVHYFNEVDSFTTTACHLALKYPFQEEPMTPLKPAPKVGSSEEKPFAGNGSVIVSEAAPSDCAIWAQGNSGLNLYASVVLRPGILPMRAPQIFLVACVALARTLESIGGVRPHLRWPNELSLNDKTVATIKMTMQSNVDKINFLILGYEVNLNGLPEELEGPLHARVTSLRSCSGKTVNRPFFAANLFRELEKWYVTYINKGPEKIIREIQHYFHFHQNKTTEIVAEGKVYSGVIEGLDTDGTLVIRQASGKVQRLTPGNIAVFP